MTPLPRRARIAMWLQDRAHRLIDRILDPWLRLIPDEPDPGVSALIDRALEREREAGRQEAQAEIGCRLTWIGYMDPLSGRLQEMPDA